MYDDDNATTRSSLQNAVARVEAFLREHNLRATVRYVGKPAPERGEWIATIEGTDLSGMSTCGMIDAIEGAIQGYKWRTRESGPPHRDDAKHTHKWVMDNNPRWPGIRVCAICGERENG